MFERKEQSYKNNNNNNNCNNKFPYFYFVYFFFNFFNFFFFFEIQMLNEEKLREIKTELKNIEHKTMELMIKLMFDNEKRKSLSGK